MAYQPKVIKAEIVSNNPKNGLFEVVVNLKDRTSCRLIYEKRQTTRLRSHRISTVC